MKTVVLELLPNSRFHFGKAAIDNNTALADTDELVHSDVLFSALINNLAKVKDAQFVGKFIDCFRKGDIKISSGFYCIRHNDKYEYLLPKPANATSFIADYKQIKPIKKIRFISSKFLQVSPDNWLTSGKLIGGKVLLPLDLELDDIGALWKNEVVPNMVIHKPNQNAEGPFSLSVIQIPEISKTVNVHFYFLYELDDSLADDMKDAFTLSVDMIKFNGLGGERSSGCGFVNDVIWQEKEWKLPEDVATGVLMNLGLFIPDNSDEFEKCMYYDYMSRGGRVTKDEGTLMRVKMLTEGSVLKMQNPPKGKIEDISPGKNGKYLRYGKPVCVNIPIFYGNE